MSLKSKLLCLILTLFTSNAIAQAKVPLSLTTTNRHGDCVHSGISIEKSLIELEEDKKYCTDNNTGNEAVVAQCLEITQARKAEPFYYDCGDDKIYIGINNQTYPIQRVGSEPTQLPSLIGHYKGKGIKVEVRPIRLLEREPDIDNAEYYEVMKYEVWLIVTKGKITKKVKGILDEGI